MGELAAVSSQRVDDVVVASVQGEVDLSNAESLLTSLLELGMAPGVSSLVADLSHTSYIDSSGIRALFELAEQLDRLGRRLQTVVPSDSPLQRVLTLAQVEEALRLQPSVEDALAALSEERSDA